jgi:EpsI family protein
MIMAVMARWAPAAVLALGSLVTVGIDTQRAVPLDRPLDEAVPSSLTGFVSTDRPISEEELRAVGVSDYLFRVFTPAGAARTGASGAVGPVAAAGAPFSLYVGYYERQERGTTIHSPKNCLPGAGWEALTSTTRDIQVGDRLHTVNQYLIQRGEQQAMVFYWYQGRGRVEANEYRVKFDLLRDTAFRGRSDEALVRIVVPVEGSSQEAIGRATDVAQAVIPALGSALPG